jgi:hypothetical protein
MAPSPAVIGVNWYSAFDSPVQDPQGRWWVGRDGSLGTVRGGHCVALKQRGATDLMSWWDFYDQGQEGACVGFGVSRMMSLLNRKRYFGRWLWDHAKMRDEWTDTNPGDDNGTSVRAGLEVLRAAGHVPWRPVYGPLNEEALSASEVAERDKITGLPDEGIAAFRWVASIDDLLEVLGYQGLQYVDLLNSWGRGYPHLTRMPVEVVDRLWREDGEIGVVTDR